MKPVEEVWRCFHCDEVFTAADKAEEHFGLGDFEFDAPACKLNVLEGGILGLYREALADLKTYQIEDNNSCREFYRLGADHYVRERRAEESGYAKGMADYRVDLGKEIAPLISDLRALYSEIPAKQANKIEEVCEQLIKVAGVDSK